MRLKERPAKRDLRLEAKDLTSSEKPLERSGPLTLGRSSTAFKEAWKWDEEDESLTQSY